MSEKNIGKGFHRIEDDLEKVYFKDLADTMPAFLGDVVLDEIDQLEMVLPHYAAFEDFYQNREAKRARQTSAASKVGNVVSLASKISTEQDWLSAA